MSYEHKNYIYNWKKDFEKNSDNVDGIFKNTFKNSNYLSSIYHPILNEFTKNEQLKHWNKDLFEYTLEKIKEFENRFGKDGIQSIIISKIHIIIDSYEQLLDIEERIILMNKFKGSEESKVKIFSLSIYNDLLNSSFSNILNFLIEIYSQIESKDLQQKTLKPLIECLSSNKRDCKKITDLADSAIRNSISHGKSEIKESSIIFNYREGKEYKLKEMSVYDFKIALLELFDGVSGVILAVFGYLFEGNVSYYNLIEPKDINSSTVTFFERLKLSTLSIKCKSINCVNTDKSFQLNIDFSNDDMDEQSRMLFGLYSAEQMFIDRNLPINSSIMVSFNSPRTLSSYFRIGSDVIAKYSNGEINIVEACEAVYHSGDLLMWEVNEEVRKKQDSLFNYYDDIDKTDFTICEIEDISNNKTKRIRGIVYLKRAKRKSHVEEVVGKAIEELKEIENFGFPTHKVKYGKMPTDVIYLTIYHRELREKKSRIVLPKNENFVVQVQYDISGEFQIKNPYIDKYLKKRRYGEIEYNWNPNF